jgi:hypothetical protein
MERPEDRSFAVSSPYIERKLPVRIKACPAAFGLLAAACSPDSTLAPSAEISKRPARRSRPRQPDFSCSRRRHRLVCHRNCIQWRKTGTNVRQRTSFAEVVGTASWAPDGKRILGSALVDDRSAVYSMNPDGTGLTRLTTPPTAHWLRS